MPSYDVVRSLPAISSSGSAAARSRSRLDAHREHHDGRGVVQAAGEVHERLHALLVAGHGVGRQRREVQRHGSISEA
jgi:hypothetical protein